MDTYSVVEMVRMSILFIVVLIMMTSFAIFMLALGVDNVFGYTPFEDYLSKESNPDVLKHVIARKKSAKMALWLAPLVCLFSATVFFFFR